MSVTPFIFSIANSLRRNYLIWAIFILALILRTYDLSSVPVGVHGDEASIGYNAYSLLKTAKDQDGNFLPLYFDQFGNFRAPGYQYIAIPFIALLDLNALSVRLPAAIFGAFSVLILYLFVKELFKSKNMSLVAAFLLAILPWHINISRATSEAVISGFFVLLGVYFLCKVLYLERISYRFLILSLFSFAASFFLYHSASAFVMIFVMIIFSISFFDKKHTRKRIAVLVIFYVALAASFIFFMTAGGGAGRVSQVSLLSIPGGTRDLKHSMDQDGVQEPLLTRFYHNKLYFYGRHFAAFYSQHLSGDFLFVNNGKPVRYKMHWTGNLYWVMAPFLIFGFAVLLSEAVKHRRFLLLTPIVWLFVAVVPAALTWEDIPNVIRSSLMIPALVIISAFGFIELINILKGRIRYMMIFIIALVLLQNSIVFLHNYFYHSKTNEPWYRSAAEEELVFAIEDVSGEYDDIVMTTENNNNLIFHLFYLKFDPAVFHELGSPREDDHLRFGKKVFRYGACPISDADLLHVDKYAKTLFVVKRDECHHPPQAEITRTIYTPDGTPAFHFVHLRNIDK
jgi:4-amino-4-deoxy-L-arabinose transferase-like glycosyltransferase